MQLLPYEQKEELKETLSYMHIAELKTLLELLHLSSKGFNKKELIERLSHYATTGKKLPESKIPLVSIAQRGLAYLRIPEALMLYGTYKNDYATRQFFKQLIGEHFHFTAQGIDWLRAKWLAGNPPTYAEFAKEWQSNYELNQNEPLPPKQEWAYIRFVKDFIKHTPQASKK